MDQSAVYQTYVETELTNSQKRLINWLDAAYQTALTDPQYSHFDVKKVMKPVIHELRNHSFVTAVIYAEMLGWDKKLVKRMKRVFGVVDLL